MPNAWESHENRMSGWESHRNRTLAVSFHFFTVSFYSSRHTSQHSATESGFRPVSRIFRAHLYGKNIFAIFSHLDPATARSADPCWHKHGNR
jgi:hypothetical protein